MCAGVDIHSDMGFENEVALMDAVTQGRKEALDVLLDRYMTIVSRTSFRILCDQEASNAVTREVFMKIWQRSTGFDGRCSLSTLIYRMTCRQCRKFLRRRWILDLLNLSPSIYETSSPQPLFPEEDYITKEAWEIFCRASRNLSAQQRTVYALCELELLQEEETGAVTGMSPGRIKDHLETARKNVISELQVYGKVR